MSFGSCMALILITDQIIVTVLLEKGQKREHHWLTKEVVTLSDIALSWGSILAIMGSVLLVVAWFLTRHWLLNNLIACAMAAVFLKVV